MILKLLKHPLRCLSIKCFLGEFVQHNLNFRISTNDVYSCVGENKNKALWIFFEFEYSNTFYPYS
jgi:hypothetical protein